MTNPEQAFRELDLVLDKEDMIKDDLRKAQKEKQRVIYANLPLLVETGVVEVKVNRGRLGINLGRGAASRDRHIKA